MLKLISAALLLSCALRLASAQDADELEKRYKGTPGGDLIIAQIEANRDKINAANAKNNADMKKAGLGGAVKSMKEILALLPAPPKTGAEAKTRLGMIDDGMGRQVDGDKKSGAASHELANALVDKARHPANMTPSAGIVRSGQGEAIKKLNAEAPKYEADSRADAAALSQAIDAAGAKLTKDLDAVVADYRIKFGDCVDGGEGVHPDVVKCRATNKKYLAASAATRDAYARSLGATIAAARAKADAGVAAGDAMIAEGKETLSSGAMASMANMLFTRVANAQMMTVQSLISANSALTVRAAEKAYTLYGE